MKKTLQRFRKRRSAKNEQPAASASSDNVRITNETVAEHREEVLSSARKYIYPLQHSKHKIVLVSTALFIVATITFFTYCILSLYRYKSTSTFLYRVTQVIPFPIAKTGKNFVAYENYLFELRRYMHYYETQQKLDFNSDLGRQQIAETKQRMLNKVVDYAYIKDLARQKKVKVSDKEVEAQVEILRAQNRLGGSDKVFEDVLKDFWGWSVDDFKRSLKQELLEQKVLAAFDTETQGRANAALGELKNGADFAAMAKKYSDDVGSKDTGGEIGFMIDRNNRDLSAQTTSKFFELQPGQFSDLINTGYSLEIIKVLERNGDKVKGAHILFNFKDINLYLNDIKDKQKARVYIRL
jgi:uncharacterized protein YkwD